MPLYFGLLLVVLNFITPLASHAETYSDAENKAEAKSSDPAVLDWYATGMQPAFRVVLGRAMARCLRDDAVDRPARVDLVFVVRSAGEVGPIFWKEASPFAACLEKDFRTATFPSPPSEFYFGVGFRIPPRQVSTSARDMPAGGKGSSP